MFACLYAPDFPVQAVLRVESADAQPVLKRSAVVVLDGPANLPKIFALNSAARKIGLAVGMTKLQVESCDGVALLKRSLKDEDSAQIALLAGAGDFSPRVESTESGTVILDLTGTEKLFGSLDNTARKMSARAAELGFELRIAIASSPDTALYAARGFLGITIIPPGQEAERLAPLRTGILPVTPELREILDGWGIYTFKALAALPEVPLVERLGQSGLYLRKLTRGEIRRTLVPVEPASEFIESYEFEDPVEILESLAFLLHRLLQQICERLASHSLATNELRLILDLEVNQIVDGSKGEQYRHTWKLPVPTQDKNVLFTLARLELEQNTFSAPIRKVTLEAVPIRPRMAQGNLFAPPSPEAQKLEITLARIRGVVGSSDVDGVGCVGSPTVLDTHKQDSFAVLPFSSVADEASSCGPALRSVTALRMFRPALETSVELSEAKPHFVRLWKSHRCVLQAYGPWCSSGNWWNSATAWVCEEWDVVLKTVGGVGYYQIYQDRIREQWFVKAVFD